MEREDEEEDDDDDRYDDGDPETEWAWGEEGESFEESIVDCWVSSSYL